MISVTETAAEKVKEILAAQNQENAFLRIYMTGMGWSGPNFGMALDESKNPEDNVDEAYGVTIVAEKRFEQYLEGAVVDYVDTENSSGFTMKTPRIADCSSSDCGSCSWL